MREIKFRAWNGIKFYEACVIGGVDWNTLSDNATGNDISQYTGLKDKNGKEIYEGDILRHKFGVIKEVYYNSGKACFEMKYSNRNGFIDSLPYFIERDCEIIGNRYQNLELI